MLNWPCPPEPLSAQRQRAGSAACPKPSSAGPLPQHRLCRNLKRGQSHATHLNDHQVLEPQPANRSACIPNHVAGEPRRRRSHHHWHNLKLNGLDP